MSRSEVVVVTGASSGVGRAVARSFARRGVRVALLARGSDDLEGARADVERADVERAGVAALVLPTDVADERQVEAAAEATEREFGPIDVWVNNAMATVFSEFVEIEPAEFRRATEVTWEPSSFRR